MNRRSFFAVLAGAPFVGMAAVPVSPILIQQRFPIPGAISSEDVQAMIREAAARSIEQVKVFAHGGSFRVGGPGIGSQLVAFKATPTERVSIT